METNEILAHAVTTPDSPLPLSYALVAGAVALFASFEVLRLRPVPTGSGPGRLLPPWAQTALGERRPAHLAGLLGLAGTGWTLYILFTGPPDGDNVALRFVFGLVWPGLAPLSALLGPVWVALNPARGLHRFCCAVLGRPEERGRPLPAAVGYWPAAAGLLAFAWWELVSPMRDHARALGWWLVAYLLVHLGAGLVYGSAWFARGDAFEAYSRLAGTMAPVRRDDDGRWRLRGPLTGVAELTEGPGLTAVVTVLIGATFFDGGSSLSKWRSLVAAAGAPVALGTAGLLATIAVVAGAFALAVRRGSAWARQEPPVRPVDLAHSLVPIAVGYLVAHYLTFMILEVRQLPELLTFVPYAEGSEPAGTGALPLPPLFISLLQIAAVVTGHVLGALACHRRALRTMPARRATVAQVPMLVCMLAITAGGLTLLYHA